MYKGHFSNIIEINRHSPDETISSARISGGVFSSGSFNYTPKESHNPAKIKIRVDLDRSYVGDDRITQELSDRLVKAIGI